MKNAKINEVYSMEKRVLERINTEKVKMLPSQAFATKKMIIWFTVFLFAAAGIFFTSIGLHKLVLAKIFGLKLISLYFPWFGLGLGLSFFMLTFAIIEKFKLFYKWSLIKLGVLLFILFVGLGFLLHKTPLHDSLMNSSSLHGIYSVEGSPLEIVAGHIVEKRTDMSFVFRSVWGVTMNVYLTKNAVVPKNPLEVNDSLFIAGNRDGNMFVASAVKSLNHK